MTAIALTIAGSDSSAGAGIQADLKTFAALGVYGASVITALTAQNTLGVQGIFDVPVDFIVKQLESVFADLAVDAVKIGMLSRPNIIDGIARELDRHEVRHIVLDPVMVANSGDRLLAPDAIETLRQVLIPQATLITPNLPEAAALLDEPIAQSEDEMQTQGEKLLALGARAVLIKGGHGHTDQSIDVLVQRSGSLRFSAPRIASRNTHGTGCTLSSAITAFLALGRPLEKAVETAKSYITAAIEHSHEQKIGHGHGPVHHFHAWWG